MLPENTSIWSMLIALVAVMAVGVLFSKLRCRRSYTADPQGLTLQSPDKARHDVAALLRRNLDLMTEAIARYQAVLEDGGGRNGVGAATALRQTYQQVRISLGRLDEVSGLGDDALLKLYTVCYAVFNEISLLCKAADMLSITGMNDFGAGFEHMMNVYQAGGARAGQPAPLPEFTAAERAEFRAALQHFKEVREDLLRALGRYMQTDK